MSSTARRAMILSSSLPSANSALKNPSLRSALLQPDQLGGDGDLRLRIAQPARQRLKRADLLRGGDTAVRHIRRERQRLLDGARQWTARQRLRFEGVQPQAQIAD